MKEQSVHLRAVLDSLLCCCFGLCEALDASAWCWHHRDDGATRKSENSALTDRLFSSNWCWNEIQSEATCWIWTQVQ